MTDAKVYALSIGSLMRCDSVGLSPELVARELPVIQSGPQHKWWLSARLLLGLTDKQAREIHSAWEVYP